MKNDLPQTTENSISGEKSRVKKSRRRYFREVRTIFVGGLFLKNPLLIGALGLFPAVAGAYSVKNALSMGIMFFIMSLPCALLMCFFGELIPAWARPGVALALMSVVYVPAAGAADSLIPGATVSLGMAAGLMICNSMALSRLNEYAPSHIGVAVFADVMGCTVGYTLILLFIGALREYLSTGSLAGTPVVSSGAALPFFGLICVGFVAAAAQWISERRGRSVKHG